MEPVRPKACYNYFELDSSSNRNSKHGGQSLHEVFKSLMRESSSSYFSSVNDEIFINRCCCILQGHFGFQSSSVENQIEHVLLLITNSRARSCDKTASDSDNVELLPYLKLLHFKLFENYKNWCKFLSIEPVFMQSSLLRTLDESEHLGMYMDICLYFLIWGEAANLRHMPECICFLYHKCMINLLDNISNGLTVAPQSGAFLNEIIRPLYKTCQSMQKRDESGRPYAHTKIQNYDDINEFFWKKKCLEYSAFSVSKGICGDHFKTFYEHRSLFTFALNFYRIFQFNCVFFVSLIVFSFAVAISPTGSQGGFRQFQTIGQTVRPFESIDLLLAFVSLFMTHSSLSTLKCVMELVHGYQLLGRTKSYSMALFLRFSWNLIFTSLFGWVVFSSRFVFNSYHLRTLCTSSILCYVLPGSMVLFLQSCRTPRIRSFLLRFTREGESCYIGQHMTPSFGSIWKYSLFWLCIWLFKALVSYFLLISPLMLPSLAIYGLKLKYASNIVSLNNIGILLSLWLPVFFVFMYDTQIYFTIIQAIVGFIQGFRLKAGGFRGFQQLTKSFRLAPQLFDQKLVSCFARSKDVHMGHSQILLRFVVVWNEIVNSFRESDLVDDKEAAILMYDIQTTGEVYEPVFLDAGKLSIAYSTLIKLYKQGKGDAELNVQLVKKDCLSAIKSFYTALVIVLEALFGKEDAETMDAMHRIYEIVVNKQVMKTFQLNYIHHVRLALIDFLEGILDLPDPDEQSDIFATSVHSMSVVRDFVSRTENLINSLNQLCSSLPEVQKKFLETRFISRDRDYFHAVKGLVNVYSNDTAITATTRAYLLLSLDQSDAMPRCAEAQRRLGFFMKSLFMDMPQLQAISQMQSFSIVTPFYSETVLFSLEELNSPLENHPMFDKVEEDGKNITILKYLITIHPEEWENFLERIDVATTEEVLTSYPNEVRLWASNRGQTLARTVQGMMLCEGAIKILHWLEVGGDETLSAHEKTDYLEKMVKLKFSYICACQVYGKHRSEGKSQADDIDFLLHEYSNLRVAYVDSYVKKEGTETYDTVLIKSSENSIMEVYRYELPGNPILGEGKPENQNNAMAFTRGEFVQTIDMNQEHYFEEALKMPLLLETAKNHPSGKPVSIVGMREHIFTGNASSLAKFKTWQELVFVTLSQRVLADPLCCRMHYGHPDVFDKVLAISRGGVSKASKGINLSEDVFAGFNSTLRGGIITHVEFMQCGKGRDVSLSQISMFEGKLANGSGETSLSREAHRLGQFLDFFRLNSFFYSHTGFYFSTWLTIVTAFVYMYGKVYIVLAGVQEELVFAVLSSPIIRLNTVYDFNKVVLTNLSAVINTQYIIQAGLFLTLPLITVYFIEMGIFRGILRFAEMICTLGPAFFTFQVGTTMHYFDQNLLHGGGKYQATGRGFKITRESFVLLYKSYSASHYRKAIELIGLCFVFLTFGNFNICYNQTKAQTLGKDFCDSAQGFGAQTFAIWFIAIIWLIVPFFFNTDGLDFAKSKVDIKAWLDWMYFRPNGPNEEIDPMHSDGWFLWWKKDMKSMCTASKMARLTILARESRHFFIMWYVITLHHGIRIVGYTAASVLVFLFLLWLQYFVGKCMFDGRSWSISIRSGAFGFWIVGTITLYFVLSVGMWNQSKEQALSLFFGFFAGLYGLNECIRALNFSSRPLYTMIWIQQLGFLFDYIFGMLLLIPLFILSSIPFMNIIQTRMMYNEGFSKVMSASAQYAFSLAAFTGILGGVAIGWLFQLLSTLDTSLDFLNYITTYDIDLDAGSGTTSYLLYLCAAAGSILMIITSKYFGRRLSIVFGGLLSLIGILCLTALHSLGNFLLFPGLACLGFSVGILIPSVVLYNFEITTLEYRSKSVILVVVGILAGMILASYFSITGASPWLWQVFIATLLLSVLTPGINLFPESPHWVLFTYGVEACLSCLVILRRKQDVYGELQNLQKELEPAEHSGIATSPHRQVPTILSNSTNIIRSTSTHSHIGVNTSSSISSAYVYSPFSPIKWLFIVLLQGSMGLSIGAMNAYVHVVFRDRDPGSLMFSNALGLQILGVCITLLIIDKLDHGNLITGILIPSTITMVLIGIQEAIQLWNPDQTMYTAIVVLFLYFLQGIGTVSIGWLAMTELFSMRHRTVSLGLSFVIFFLSPLLEVSGRIYFTNTYSFIFVNSGINLLIIALVLIGFGHRTNGALCTKTEMIDENKRVEKARLRHNEFHEGRLSSLSSSARNRTFNRSRAKSVGSKHQLSYQLYETPGAN